MKKAFDWVDRDILNYKLLSVGINGKIYEAIKQLYRQTTSCIKLNSSTTEWFDVKSGVRQGDSLSPTLFNIYINDLVNELNSLNIGININGRQICCLLYADDIVIFCNSEENLQKLLDRVHSWCLKWKMQLNYTKSNIVHFRTNRRPRTTFSFKCGNNDLLTLNNYKYLGVLLDEHLNFAKGVEELCHSAGRALGSVIGKFKRLRNVGFNTYTNLYNACVRPIIEYSSAIWKDKRYTECNKIFNRAIRYLLGLPRNTPIGGMHGDMGWITPKYNIYLNKIRLWNRFSSMHPDRLAKCVFEWDWLKRNNNWSSELLLLFKKLEMSDAFYNQSYCDTKNVECKLYYLCSEEWKESLLSFPKLRTYTKFKSVFSVEPYLLMNLPKSKRC